MEKQVPWERLNPVFSFDARDWLLSEVLTVEFLHESHQWDLRESGELALFFEQRHGGQF